MNENRKKLSKLLVPLLALQGVSMDAMEKVNSMRNWKLPLSQNIPLDGKYMFENSYAKAKWHNVDELMTINELEDYLNKHRSDIFYAMHQGDEARKIANEKIERKQENILNAFKKWHAFTKKRWEEKMKLGGNKVSHTGTKWHDVDWNFKKTGSEEHKKFVDETSKKFGEGESKKSKIDNVSVDPIFARQNKENFINTLSFNAKDGYKKNWAKLGRGPLHESGKGEENILQAELIRAQAGDVNCTIWATLINWFLNENGYPANVYHRPGHEFVVAPVTDKNKEGLYLCYIGVDEKTDSLDEAKICVTYLCKKKLTNKVWLGMQLGFRSNSRNTLDQYSPTFYQYSDLIYGNKYFDKKQLTGITKGIQQDFKYWHEKGKIKTDMTKTQKTRTYSLKILPREGRYIRVPLNLEYIDHVIDGENGKKIYTKKQGSPGTNNQTNLIYTDLFFGNEVTKIIAMDDLLEHNLKISIDPTQDKNKRDTYTCTWEIPDKNSKWRTICSGTADIKGLDTPINEAVAFWNDPNYKDPVEIKKDINKEV